MITNKGYGIITRIYDFRCTTIRMMELFCYKTHSIIVKTHSITLQNRAGQQNTFWPISSEYSAMI